MPKGVEHLTACGFHLFQSTGVESLMPKGVEHIVKIEDIQAWLGVESLMPKGVEHFITKPFLRLGWFGVESLMPKGVEHIKKANHCFF